MPRVDNVTELLIGGATPTNENTLPAGPSPTVFKTIAAVAVTAGTPVAAWTPASGKKFRLMGYALSLSVAGSVILDDGTATTDEFLRTPLMAAGVGQPSPNLGYGYVSTAADNALHIDATASGSVTGFVFGVEE